MVLLVVSVPSPHRFTFTGLCSKKAKHSLVGEICYSKSRGARTHVIAPFAFQPLPPELFHGVLIFYFEQTLLSIHSK